MTFQIHTATKQKTKLKLALEGTAGSGKTYSALLLASGIVPLNKVCIIDTENGSADLYDHLGKFSVISLTQPFSPERYIEAIDSAQAAGFELIIIDSITHEWDGVGGILDIHQSMTGNSFTNWGKLTPRHNAFIQKILQTPLHMIATLRTKSDYVLQERNGKQVPEKIGLKAITREGVDYEFTLVFDLDIKHNATASKDRTGVFMDKPQFVIGKETGEALIKWANEGKTVQEVTVRKEEIKSPTVVDVPKEPIKPFVGEADLFMPKEEKEDVCPLHDVKMERRTNKNGGEFYFHSDWVEGKKLFCNGKGWKEAKKQ